jgi:hypothetical protein
MVVIFYCLPFILSANGLNTASAADDDLSPLAGVPRTVADLGKEEEGDALTACFAIHNNGKGMLCIREVKSGCDCTRVKHPQTIAPGSRAEVCLNIDTLGMHGRHKFKTAVYCNDPARPVIVLQVRAQIAPMVTLTPDRIFFKAMAGSDLKQMVRIATKGERPLNVKLESHNLGEKIAVDLVPIAAGKQYRLTVQNSVSASGSYRGRILLRSDHPGRERIVVPVFAHLTPPVAVYPSRLVLDTGKCHTCRALGRYKGTLVVRAYDKETLRILGVAPERMGLTCEIEPLIAGRAYRLNMAYDAGSGAPLPEHLVLKTNRSDLIKIPLYLSR